MGLTGRQPEGDDAVLPVGGHARLGPITTTRAAKSFTSVSLGRRSPLWAAPAVFLVCPHVRAVEEHHPELNAALLHKVEQLFPNAGTGPADEDLRRSPPRTQFLRNGPPFGAVLMPLEDGRERALQILRRLLGLGQAGINRRLQFSQLRVTQHRSSCLRKMKTQDEPIRPGDDMPKSTYQKSPAANFRSRAISLIYVAVKSRVGL
jgi:hypothetical protein